MINKLVKYLAIPLIAGSVFSCRDFSQDFSKIKQYENFKVLAKRGGSGNVITMSADSANLFGFDYNVDTRFDEIDLAFVPKGHFLEQYANLDSISKYFNEVKETGEDIY